MIMCMLNNNIICVTNRKLCKQPLKEQIKKISENSIKNIILREKDLSEQEYLNLAREIIDYCPDINLIVHNFPEIALKLNIKSIHLPLPILKAKNSQSYLNTFKNRGCSVHSTQQALEAEKLGATYLTAGHIFETSCKPDLPPRGLEFLKSICLAVNIPVYAIGGIDKNNLDLVVKAGAKGGCIMSGLMKI